ncbi:hypothetical protein Tco_1112017 [Tanacetum coccineum]|uniref:Uncharacterized protein n=1 Tax=Tanacetum coccineum TaxID=301880 RepID=A0ABQ5IRQ9_9ASTR
MASLKVLKTQFQMFIKSWISVKEVINEREKHKEDIQLGSGTPLKEQDTSSRSGNDADIRPIYNEEPMAVVQMIAEINVFAIGQQHTKQPEFNNEGEKGTHGQFSKVKSNEAKVKHDIDVIETINIKLEHKVAKLLKENETLKRHYKELYDSIKTTRAKNIEHTISLIANNNKFKAQLQEKGFAIAALKNELRKLTGNSVNTKFAKLSILGKPALQPRRNQSIVRQPTAFKSERPRFSKQRFASRVDVNNDLSKPVTTHYLPKERESLLQNPSHDCNQASWWKPTGKIFKTVGLKWVPTGNIFTSSITKVDSAYQNGSNDDITNQYECKQTLDISAETQASNEFQSDLAPPRQMTSDHNSSELRIHDHSNELSSSKLVPKVVPPADKTATSRQELELLFHHHITMLRSYALSWKPCQGDSLNLPDHRIHKDGDGDALFQLESDSLPHAHAQTTKTYYKHQDSRIMKAQELKTKSLRTYKIFLQRY